MHLELSTAKMYFTNTVFKGKLLWASCMCCAWYWLFFLIHMKKTKKKNMITVAVT